MHSDDPAGVPPENEKQPEPDQQSSTASPNASPASNEKQPERAQQSFTISKSAHPSSARPPIAATLMKAERERRRDEFTDREMWRKEMERRRANEIKLYLEHRHTQLSDAIKDTEYLLTLKLTTKERGYVKRMFTVLSLWRRGANELLCAQLSDAHSHWLKYPEMFLYQHSVDFFALAETAVKCLRINW